ncbi:MAG: hypothetical protein E2O75_09445 [Chloroflexi bacterium]|nr:MAG: hypothetical protein E2O75_09445 [Chloroflexota bacterium]
MCRQVRMASNNPTSSPSASMSNSMIGSPQSARTLSQPRANGNTVQPPPAPHDMLIAANTLTQFVTVLFTSAGVTAENSAIVASHLVDANLKGHDSHGVGMIPHYIRNLLAKSMSPNAEIKVLKDNGAILLIDGCAGFGQVVGAQATKLALERVKDTGIVCVGLRNAHHLGRIGSYGEQCGNAGYVSIHFVNEVGHAPQVSPWGGSWSPYEHQPVLLRGAAAWHDTDRPRHGDQCHGPGPGAHGTYEGRAGCRRCPGGFRRAAHHRCARHVRSTVRRAESVRTTQGIRPGADVRTTRWCVGRTLDRPDRRPAEQHHHQQHVDVRDRSGCLRRSRGVRRRGGRDDRVSAFDQPGKGIRQSASTRRARARIECGAQCRRRTHR